MNSLLSVQNLSVTLHNGAPIVDQLSLELHAGETFALLGESGCGKSMTALSLLRLLPDGVVQAGGQVQLAGESLLDLPDAAMRKVRGGRLSMIFQEPGLSLNPVMTVGEQLLESLRLHGAQASAAACVALLAQVGIPDPARRLHEYPFQLSGGMKQRIMIAMALAGEPQVLVADEPTTALDVTIQAQVLQLLRDTQARNQMAILLITHDLGVVANMAQHVAVMYAGQIVEKASCAALFAGPLHPYTRQLFATLPDASRRAHYLNAIPGTVPAPGSVRQGCRFAARCDEVQTQCREKTPALHTLDSGQQVRCHLYAQHSAPGMRSTSLQPSQVNAPAANAPTLLEVENMRVHFPLRRGLLQRVTGHVKAVDGISLRLLAGKTMAIVGESGCGKTTLGKAILHLIPPSAGQITFAGQPIHKLAQQPGMQMVFQDPYASLNPKMRIAEILQESLDARATPLNAAARTARIEQLLQQVGLPTDSQWRYPHEFSGGQRQRIAIARALAVEPQLLICDEPTSALDVSVQAQILNLLKKLQQELQLAYLFITHNLAVVSYLADEIGVMYLGRLVERGPAQSVLAHPQHPYTQALLAAVPSLTPRTATTRPLTGELPSPAQPPAGCHFAPRCPKVEARCHLAYPPAITTDSGSVVHCYLVKDLTL